MKPNRRFFSIIAVAILTIAFSAFSKGGKPKAQFKGYAKMDGGTYFLLLKTGTGTTPVDTGGAVFVKIKFKTDKDSVFLVVGDRMAGDEVTYPDMDLELKAGPDGVKAFRHKDGTPYPRVTRD